MILFDCEEPKPLRRPEVRNRVEGGGGRLGKDSLLGGVLCGSLRLALGFRLLLTFLFGNFARESRRGYF